MFQMSLVLCFCQISYYIKTVGFLAITSLLQFDGGFVR